MLFILHYYIRLLYWYITALDYCVILLRCCIALFALLSFAAYYYEAVTILARCSADNNYCGVC